MFSPHAFSRAWRQLHVFASNSDWLVVLFTPVVIGQCDHFGFGFYDTQLKTALVGSMTAIILSNLHATICGPISLSVGVRAVN